MINKRKRDLNVTNIDAHMFDDRFDDQFQYIRANLSRTSVITDKCCGRKLCAHENRLLRVLKINKSLQEEYNAVVQSRYTNTKW
jgi:Baculovirus LEF-11 protein